MRTEFAMLDSLTMQCQAANNALRQAMTNYRAIFTDPTSTADAQNGARTALINAQQVCAAFRLKLDSQMQATLQ